MTMKLYNETSIADIADSIRAKNGGSSTYTVSQMAGAIDSLSDIESTVVYSQLNAEAADFLADVTYDPSDYSTSQIGFYSGRSTSYRKDQPMGVSLTVKRVGKLAVIDSSMGVTETRNVNIGAATVYNLTPGNVNGYCITENNNIVQAGGLLPTGNIRMIRCPTANNVRDLGGWSCDGGTVRYNKLFRGGGITASDRSVLVDQCGVRHDLDLRSSSESGSDASVLGRDIKYHVFDRYFMYSLADTEMWRKNLSVVFDAVKVNEPVYFHCSMGADRTGTFACVLEALLGVSQSDIDKDYELTSFYAMRARNGNYQGGGNTDWAHLIAQINSLNGSTFRDKAVNFVISLGFSIDDINSFRAAMIDGTPAVLTVPTVSVTGTYSGCATSNQAATAALYQPYTATITANSGYSLDDAAVTVTMGGVDITSGSYSNGTITISRVTGALIISVAAVQDVPDNLFISADAVDGARLNSSGNAVSYAAGQVVTAFIAASSGDIIYVESDKAQNTNGYTGMLSAYNSSGSHLGQLTNSTPWVWNGGKTKGYITIPSGTYNGKNYSTTAKIRLCIAYTSQANIIVNRLASVPVLS